ncbi:MAG: class I SAM-dependent methyltransferase [Peptostreptococcaceae bacterium]
MKLTDRLLKIASLVTEKTVADIGTDHGYIPIHLLNENKVDFAILADINKGPLMNAKGEVDRNNLGEKVDLRLGSGLEVLEKGEVSEVIIAGMGGSLISKLLENKLEVSQSINKLILQPMQSQETLRKYLLNNGFEILDEVLVKEDFRVYEIICTKYTGKNTKVDEIYYEIGQKLIENKDPLLNELIDKKIEGYKNVIIQIEDHEKMTEKLELMKNRIDELKNLKQG